jgi:xanthine dehydrogenase accessory factor
MSPTSYQAALPRDYLFDHTTVINTVKQWQRFGYKSAAGANLHLQSYHRLRSSPHMHEWLQEIAKRSTAGEPVALCTVVGSRGSTPQSTGARMVLLPNGLQVGTLGGGCVEAEVRQRALKMLSDNQSGLLTFKLDHDYGWDDGLICGGTMHIYVQTLSDAEAATDYRSALDALRSGQKPTLAIEYATEEGERKTYSETLVPPPKLLIAGAGHVGQALARLAADAGFEITIIDDRADLTSADRFPAAKERIIGDIESELRRQPIDPETYIVIVTRGHKHDGHALAAVVNSPAKYIGLIGSRRKVITIFQDLLQQGIPIENLLRVHAPIGLEIGAVTVPEIAVSIAAELVAVRHGMDGQPAQPMKFDMTMLRGLLEQKLD